MSEHKRGYPRLERFKGNACGEPYKWLTHQFNSFPGLAELDKLIFDPWSFTTETVIKGNGMDNRGVALLPYKPPAAGTHIPEDGPLVSSTVNDFGFRSLLTDSSVHIIMADNKSSHTELYVEALPGNRATVIEVGRVTDLNLYYADQTIVYTNSTVWIEEAPEGEVAHTVLNEIGFVRPDKTDEVVYFKPVIDEKSGRITAQILTNPPFSAGNCSFAQTHREDEYAVFRFTTPYMTHSFTLPLSVLKQKE